MIARVLLADDDPMIRRALSASLSRAGFEVVAVDDGAPAIAAASSTQFDVVIADMNMRTVHGNEVVRYFKQKYGRAVCCLILSGEVDEGVRAACYAAGADDVVLKPITPAALRARILTAATALRGHDAA